nr:unnamed protein product [Digitaria exilis]
MGPTGVGNPRDSLWWRRRLPTVGERRRRRRRRWQRARRRPCARQPSAIAAVQPAIEFKVSWAYISLTSGTTLPPSRWDRRAPSEQKAK